jgi:hypothetical protein
MKYLVMIIAALALNLPSYSHAADGIKPSRKVDIPILAIPKERLPFQAYFEKLPVNIDKKLIKSIDAVKACTVRGWLKDRGSKDEPFFIYWDTDHENFLLGLFDVGISSIGDRGYVPIQRGHGLGSFWPPIDTDRSDVPLSKNPREIDFKTHRSASWIRNLVPPDGYGSRLSFELRLHKKESTQNCVPIRAGNECETNVAYAEYVGRHVELHKNVVFVQDIGEVVVRQECESRGLWPISNLWSDSRWAYWRFQKPFYSPTSTVIFPKF